MIPNTKEHIVHLGHDSNVQRKGVRKIKMTVINTREEGYKNEKVGKIWNDVGKMRCRRALMMVEENEAMEQ